MARNTRREAEWILKVRDQATQSLRKMDQRVAELDKHFKRVGDTSSRSSAKTVAGLKAIGAAIAGIGIARLGRDVLRAGTDFERASVVIAGLGSEMRGSIEDINEAARQQAVRYGAVISDVTAAQFDYLSATQDVEGQSVAVGEALKLSAAGGTTAAISMDALTTIMGNYSIEGERSTEVSEALFRSQQRGKATMGQLAASIGNVATSARAANVDYREMLGALSAVTAGGLGGAKTSVGATSIARMFDAIAVADEKVIAKSREMAEAAGVVNFEFSKQQLAADGLAKFLEKLSKVTNGDAAALKDLGIAVEAAKGAQILLKDGAVATTAAIEDQKRAANELDAAMGVYESTMAARMDRLNALWGEAKLALFDEFLDPAKGGFEAVNAEIDDVREGVSAFAGAIKLIALAVVNALDLAQVAVVGVGKGIADLQVRAYELGESIGVASEEGVRDAQALADAFGLALNDELDDVNQNADAMVEAFDRAFGDGTQRKVEDTRTEIEKLNEAFDKVLSSPSPSAGSRTSFSLLDTLPGFGGSGGGGSGPGSRDDAAIDRLSSRLEKELSAAYLAAGKAGASARDAEMLDISAHFRTTREAILAEEGLTQREREDLIAQANRIAAEKIKALDKRLAAERAANQFEIDRQFADERLEALTSAKLTEMDRLRAVEEDERRRQQALASLDFDAGFRRGVEEVQHDARQLGDLGLDVAHTLNRGFGDVAVSGMLRFGDASESAADRMRNAFVRALEDIASVAIRTGASAFFGSLFASGPDVTAGTASGSSFDLVGTSNFARSDVALAAGGVVRGPTKALIGEAGPEAVVPLPGGRAIPVDLRGTGESSGQSVVINYAPTLHALDGPSAKALLVREREVIEAIFQDSTRTSNRTRDAIRRVR